MTRIEPLSGARAPLLLRLLNIGLRKMAGREVVPFNLMGYSPRMLLPYLFMGVFAQGSKQLDPHVRVLALHLVSEINGCSWCVDFSASLGQQLGVPAEKLQHLVEYRTSALFNERERAALAFAETVTQVGAPVSDEQFAELRRWFSDGAIVELLAAICSENFFNRFNIALGVESQGFCAVPMPMLRRAA
jgi:AhpD family alkylhydroperoxidase